MISLSPKEQFLANRDECIGFANVANSALVQKAFTHALASMALDGWNEDELRGAKALVARFLNMAEKEEPAPRFPQRTLKTYAPQPPETPK